MMARVYYPDELFVWEEPHALLEVEGGLYRLDLLDGQVMVTLHVEGPDFQPRWLRRPDVQAALAEAEEVLVEAAC